MRPTRLPTTRPSRAPSYKPTFRPSIIPTYSGETINPTFTPTVSPSIDLKNLPSSKFYKSYINQRNSYRSDKNKISYASFNYRGIAIDCDCSQWNTFIVASVTLPDDRYMFTELALANGYQNFTNGYKSNQTYYCNDDNIINAIALALVSSSTWRGYCNGRRWVIGKCANTKVLCVNCDKIDCGCSSTSLNSLSCNNNDCTSTIVNSASYYIISFIIQLRLTASKISYDDVLSTRDSILISLNVTYPGTVYCNAFVFGYALSSHSIPHIKNEGYTAITLTGYSSVYIDVFNLVPETKYDIYCYWEDFSTDVMSLMEVNATRRSLTTACCRSMSWVTVYSSIVIDEISLYSSETYFSFQLDAAPLKDTIISASISTSTSCNGSVVSNSYSKAFIEPDKFLFPKDSMSMVHNFKIRGTLGCYKVSLSATSGTYYPDISTTFAIQTIPPAPFMTSCSFDSSGIKALISFNSDTDQGASIIDFVSAPFICSILLSYAGATHNTCLWLSKRQLQVNNPLTLKVGDKVAVVGQVLRASCASDTKTCSLYPYSTYQSIVIERPMNPMLPVVSLSTTGTISLCDDIVLDPTNSYGSGGRPWLIAHWKAIGSGNMNKMSHLLNSLYNTTTDLVTIPSTLLSNGTVTITLYLTNYLLGTSAATVTVSILEYFDAPVVRIVGPSRVTAMRWQSLSLSATAKMSSCAGTSSQRVIFKWKVYTGTQLQSNLTSISADPKSFKLPPYVLSTGFQYTVQVEVSYSGSISTNTAAVSVIVGRAGVNAAISGGASQIFSQKEISVLDARVSADIDYPGSSNIAFLWQCSQFYPNYGSACGFSLLTNASILRLPANISTGNHTVYLFSVLVTSLIDGLQSQASVQVTLVSAFTPKLLLPPLTARQNTHQKIILAANIVSIRPMFYVWLSGNSSINISSVTSSTLSGRIGAGSVTLQLTLRANSLYAGLYYTFQLKSYYVGAKTSEFSLVDVTILINKAVYGGSLAVTPPIGFAFNTSFYFLTQGWLAEPDNYPLLYSMSYSTTDATSAVIVKGRSPALFASAFLSAGLQSRSYAVTCYVQAIDIFGGVGKASTQVFVYLPSLTLASINTFITEIIGDNIDFDPDLITQIAYSAANTLSTANCSLAPLCLLLKRENCSVIAHTCGPCLSGYLGVPGPANTVCSNISTVIRDGRYCRRDSECLSGLCVNQTCMARMKMCSANCSNAGECRFYDSSTNALVPSCYYTDNNCSAKCLCYSGYSGFDCSVNATELSDTIEIRQAVCSGLLSSISVQVMSFPYLKIQLILTTLTMFRMSTKRSLCREQFL